MSKSSLDKFGSKSGGSGGDKVKELKNMLSGKKKDAEKGKEKKDVDRLPEADHAVLDKEIKTLQDKLKKSEETASKNKEQYLRTLAEFENFRKRMEREKDEMIKYGNEKLLKELFPVLDHLEMTVDHAEKDDPILEGVQLVVKQFYGVLEKFGIQVVTGEGLPFDPHRQESIGTIETADSKPGTVVKVNRKGFMLTDRLIRPALVTVAKSPKDQKTEKEENKETIH